MAAPKKPNIVLITLDECKASAISCYGNNEAYTPNIDSFCDQGVMFTNCFTTFPKCVPSRCAMLTGRYPHSEGHRTLPGFMIRREEDNFMTQLKENGYLTALFGKNHSVEPDNLNYCFDKYFYTDKGKPYVADAQDINSPNLYRAFYRHNPRHIDGLQDTYNVKAACDFIVNNSHDPFFLYLDIDLPHPVYQNIDPYIDKIRQKNLQTPKKESLEKAPYVLKKYRTTYDLEMLSDDDWVKIVEAYYSMVSFSDHCVGQVLDVLDRQGIADNTIVIVTSDHGDFAGEHGCVEKFDTMFYDCLIKIPLIIRYPALGIKPAVVDAMAENIDIMPTVFDLCGIDVSPYIHGKSLKGLLLGECSTHRDAVFCEGGMEKAALDRALSYSDEHYKKFPDYYYKQKTMVDYPETMMRSKMIRTKKWKFIFRANGMNELYDLENDPMELVDVSAEESYKPVMDQFIKRLLIWAINTETDYPHVNVMHA